MEEATEVPVQCPDIPKRLGTEWQILWFFAHLAAVYIMVNSVTSWLAGWTWRTLLPLLQIPNRSLGHFDFLFTHLFAFSFLPAFLAGFNNLRFKH
jgi:hypothetical protein